MQIYPLLFPIIVVNQCAIWFNGERLLSIVPENFRPHAYLAMHFPWLLINWENMNVYAVLINGHEKYASRKEVGGQKCSAIIDLSNNKPTSSYQSRTSRGRQRGGAKTSIACASLSFLHRAPATDTSISIAPRFFVCQKWFSRENKYRKCRK